MACLPGLTALDVNGELVSQIIYLGVIALEMVRGGIVVSDNLLGGIVNNPFSGVYPGNQVQIDRPRLQT